MVSVFEMEYSVFAGRILGNDFGGEGGEGGWGREEEGGAVKQDKRLQIGSAGLDLLIHFRNF